MQAVGSKRTALSPVRFFVITDNFRLLFLCKRRKIKTEPQNRLSASLHKTREKFI
ncbi:hypothetical protein EUBSIR_00686 [[Eubacterium] siraeum DSM 15702]|uniref:Uncharacterized protein n=1 Tax=[Eubacterium] siraeum DSM 15702 TaxID=428128 RepID=B0MLJ9_9FIRM|nr:hypothetical protein EUBSIR_00686 [[Eubacterium] siraeum DSM 15702]